MNGMLLALLLFVQGLSVPGTQTGIIAGRVFNVDGTPAARMRVVAQALEESPVAAAEGQMLSSIVQTDAQGNYRLEGVIPGRFYIAAGLVELPTYYPGVTSIEDARIVTVTAGAALSGIDFKLIRSTGLTLRGHARLEPGAVMPQWVLLMRGGATTRTFPAPDGAFTFERVVPGRYTLGSSPATGLPLEIVLEDKNLDVDLTIKPTVAISGKVVVEGDGPKPHVNLQFQSGSIVVVAARTAANGIFNLQLPAGRFRVVATGVPPGYQLKSITAGSLDWTKDEVEVRVGTPLPPFVVAFDVASPPPWVKVRGRVIGDLKPGHTVTLSGMNSGETLQTPVNGDGTFEFAKVIPGVSAVRTLAAGESSSPYTTLITVGPINLENVEVVIPRIKNIPGKVVAEGGARQGLPQFMTLGFTLAANALSSGNALAGVGSNGVFSLRLFEGEYLLSLDAQASGLAGYSVKSVTYGSESSLAGPIKVTSTDEGKELVVTLERSTSNVKITGRVTNLPRGGSSRITLSGVGINMGPLDAIRTDDTGVFEIPDVPAGAQTLWVSSGTEPLQVSTTINVSPGKDVTGIEIPMPSTHSISGNVVLDPDGTPLQPRFSLALTGSRPVSIVPTVRADGSFTIRLPLGEWSVRVAGLRAELNLKSFFYGDKNLIEEKIDVVQDDTRQLRMVLAPRDGMVNVGGRIILSPNATLNAPVIRLSGVIPAEATIDADGKFEFQKILPGTYSWTNGFGMTSLVIPNRNPTDLTLRVISGRVVYETGDRVVGLTLRATGNSGLSSALVRPGGSFVFVLDEGKYRFELPGLSPGTSIKSIRYGPTELSNQSLELTRGVELLEMIVTLSSR
jgi:hypothetical protein